MRRAAFVVGCCVLVAAGVTLIPRGASASGPCVVPKAWGQFKGAYESGRGLNLVVAYFEAADGTIRATSPDGKYCEPGKPMFEIRRGE